MTADRVRVFVLCPGSTEGAGGIGRFVETLTAGLQSHPALELQVLNTRGDGAIVLAPFFFARAVLRVLAASMSRRPPILHVNLASRGSAARKYIIVALASALRLPVILHLHGGGFERFHRGLSPILQRAVRAMFARAERVLVLGPSWRDFVAGTLTVPVSRIAVVPNGAPLPARTGGQDGEATPHIVFLGRLSPAKGVYDLLEALASPHLADRAWRATLAGDGDSAPFRAASGALGLAERVQFPGWLGREASASLLRSATVFVLPSHVEGFPMAVVEALALGIPVITTSVGAIPDFLEEARSALLLPPGDPKALADALARALGSPELRARLSRFGHEVFARHFDAASIARRLAGLYLEVDAAHRYRTPAALELGS